MSFPLDFSWAMTPMATSGYARSDTARLPRPGQVSALFAGVLVLGMQRAARGILTYHSFGHQSLRKLRLQGEP